MKTYLLSAITMALCLIPSIANAYDFIAESEEGVLFCYNILSEEDKTCEVAFKEDAKNYYVGKINIPSTAGDYKVTKIGTAAFATCEYITEVHVSQTVTSIGNQAFSSCTRLKTISLPEELKEISSWMFSGCQNLQNVNIPKGIKSIGMYSFAGCTLISNIEIPNTVETIGSNAFNDCNSLKSVVIPQSVTSIGAYAFNCANLSFVISEITDVMEIDEKAFYGRDEATTLYVPYGLEFTYRRTIGWNKFVNIEEMPSEEPTYPFLLSCNTKGSVTINGTTTITSNISSAEFNEDAENTFTFIPKTNCKLEQVVLNGLDITANVENNTLTTTIQSNSQMIVTFSAESGDLNNDGRIDITDVVSIVNKILGN